MECNVSTNPNVSRNYTDDERTCYLAHLQLYSTYTMIPAIIFLGVLCVVGIIGNSIVLFVYSQRFRSTASGTFIMAIAVFDLMANIMLIPGDIHSMFHHWDFDMVYPCKLRLYGHAVTHGASSLFLAALAVTRYRKICKPFCNQVTVKQARITCIGLTFLAIVLSILYFIIQGIQKKKTPNPNIFGYVCYVDDKFNGTALHKINTTLFVLFFITVSSLLVVLYVKIWFRAKRHHNRKPSTHARGVSEQETEMTSFADVSFEPTSNTFTNTASTLESVNGAIQAGKNIKIHEPSTSLSSKLLEFKRRKRNTMLISSFRTVKELSKYQHRDPENIEPEQRDRANSIRNKALSKSCECVDFIPSAGNPSPHQTSYTSILKKSASSANHFASDLQIFKSYEKVETTRLKRSVTLSTFDINKSFSAENKSLKIKTKRPKRRRGSGRITCMLVTISSIYILSLLPFMVFNAIKTVAPEFPESMNFHVQSLYHFLFRSYLINTAVNPIVYSFCDVKFRKECLSQFRSLTCH
ncbi:uncharacterized protein LOC131955212 [Physella acuta]|uniref:uncharacterized protein LOC131955212 n=1 Tax=Physella acuta TaxID=109671 RepID=UPI0027DCA868|nr:uncharacterized protein LOC131955212 [Physella acuta]